jgi:hypothetical protein
MGPKLPPTPTYSTVVCLNLGLVLVLNYLECEKLSIGLLLQTRFVLLVLVYSWLGVRYEKLSNGLVPSMSWSLCSRKPNQLLYFRALSCHTQKRGPSSKLALHCTVRSSKTNSYIRTRRRPHDDLSALSILPRPTTTTPSIKKAPSHFKFKTE